ncbi:MAG: penicillin-binding protein 1A [Gemmatimonadota bacterium]
MPIFHASRRFRRPSLRLGRWLDRWSSAHGAVSLGLAFLLFAGLGIAWGAWDRICLDERCPSVAQITTWEPEESSKVFAADGTLLGEFFQERRTVVRITELPAYVPQGFIAIEDKRFHRHDGLDFIAITRAVVENLLTGFDAGGGSTITQQLARNQFSEIGFRRSLWRKLKEAKVAKEIERVYSKAEILEAYVNEINFGHGWYGIETASQNYFGKPARELNLPEAAMLAALPKAPTRYSPFANPENALRRRNLVLNLMAEQGYIPRAAAEAAKGYPLPVRGTREVTTSPAPYVVEWIRQLLDARYGSDLYRAGLRIYTGIDLELQAIADSALHAQLVVMEGVPEYPHPTYEGVHEQWGDTLRWDRTPYIQGTFVAIDLETGVVKALVGGRDFGESEFNRAVQGLRQPGSVFKPFVYTAAIASGFPASHVLYDSPVEYEQYDPEGDSSYLWSPKNYTNTFGGPTTLRDGLRRSVNVVTVKLADAVGFETVGQYARRMGVQTPIPRVPSMAIGSGSAIPLQVMEAYTTFGNLGVRVTPQPIVRIEDKRGRLLWEMQVERERVLDPQTAWVVLSMLRDVVDRGTGYSIRDRGLSYDIPAGGKTGTTDENTDVWFVGFTPELLAGIWIGFDQPKKIFDGAVGGAFAAPVWGAFMQRVYADRPAPAPWARPGGLIYRDVDPLSGKLATEYCPPERVYTEVYIPGTEPTENCDLHGPVPWGLRAPLDTFRPDTGIPRERW